ncbi:hypothetical protein FNF27_00558 [Cafeteria roenbergensis]|uniref:Fungal lipase-type domain-containing protein n=1 Tax=Cafeteria roenbergensis TaxID=33653 RepID=A0A5A8EPU1_CAFRO|nr:hypothetical protein FNF31_04305 [Cafeteria roenbergensis]KAA0178010.1 hypothetical protein FNF27_00558 [Cafeteria roenbergensis]|mmetsp:Transcript_5529/g.23441  ORF Transcript_5529/g.23441 Transcript_5529/m.23441 type:complete len:1174 (-) Transcript_5529:136-3657(-)
MSGTAKSAGDAEAAIPTLAGMRTRAAPARVRLETLGSFASQCLLFCVYAIAAAAIGLSLSVQLSNAHLEVRLENSTSPCQELAWPSMSNLGPISGGAEAVSGGICISSSTSQNSTTWLLAVDGLTRLDGGFEVAARVASPVAEGDHIRRVVMDAVLLGSSGTSSDKDPSGDLGQGEPGLRAPGLASLPPWLADDPGAAGVAAAVLGGGLRAGASESGQFPPAPQGYSLLLATGNVSVAAAASCPSNGGLCSPAVQLLSQVRQLGADSPGGFERLLVGVTLRGASPDRLDALVANSTLLVQWTAGAAVAADTTLRQALFGITLLSALAVVFATCIAPPPELPPEETATVGCRPCRGCSVFGIHVWAPCSALCDLPQRPIILVLLVGTLLWQLPVTRPATSNAEAPSGAAASPQEEAQRAWLQRALTSLGWTIMLACSLALVESIRDAANRIASGRVGCSVCDFCRWTAIVLWACVTLASSFLLAVLADPYPFFPDANAGSPFGPNLSLSFGVELAVIAGITYAGSLVVFMLVVLVTVCRAGRRLRGLAYAATRYYQLTWRLFVWLQLLVLAFVVIVNTIPALGLFGLIQRPGGGDQATLGADSGGNSPSAEARTRIQILNGLRLLVNGVQPTGELLIVTAYAVLMAFAFLPPGGVCPLGCVRTIRAVPGCVCCCTRAAGRSASDAGGDDDERHSRAQPATAMLEGTAAQAASMLGLSDRNRASAITVPGLFSINAASWLLDMAWLAYDEATAVEAKEALSRGAPATAVHGFSIEAVLDDPELDTRVLVLRRAWRVVVSARGTVTKKNFWTDLRASRSPTDVHGRLSDLASRVPVLKDAFPLTHTGFQEAYAGIRANLQAAVRSALASAGSGCRLYLTGHSLGGALATLAAIDLAPDVKHARESDARIAPASGIAARLMSSIVPRSYDGRRFGKMRDGDFFGSSDRSAKLMARGSSGADPDALAAAPAASASAAGAASASGAGAAAKPKYDAFTPADCGVGIFTKAHEERDDFDPRHSTHNHSSNRRTAGMLGRMLGEGLPGAGDSVVLMTFGSPRVGNGAFARAFNWAVPLAWRVEMEQDFVVTVPKFCCLFRHVGVRVVADDIGNLIVDPSPLEQSLRIRSRTSSEHHKLGFYRRSMLRARQLANMRIRSDPDLKVVDSDDARDGEDTGVEEP